MCKPNSVWINRFRRKFCNPNRWKFPRLSPKCILIFCVAFMTTVLILKTAGNVNSKSSNMHPNDRKPLDATWQIVNGTRSKFFVYSAFYDRRGEKIIRIVGGTTKSRVSDKVWCRFWYNDNAPYSNNGSVSVMAHVQTIREHHDMYYYSACYVICPVELPQFIDLRVPYAVSVVSELTSPPGNLLLVRNTDDDDDLANTMNITNVPDEIGACVAPFHSSYNSAMRLIEFIELNSLLGISHFTFYNGSLGPQASCVMKHYTSDSFSSKDNQKLTITLLPWNFSLVQMKLEQDVRLDAIYSALNDCAYRSMYRYKYAAWIDVDEFLIPRQSNTLIDFLKTQESIRNTGAYYFGNAFFCYEYPDDPVVSSLDNSISSRVRAALISQKKTVRRAKLSEIPSRSKYLFRPDYIVEVGNNFVWEFMPGKDSFDVSEDMGTLQHYRFCEGSSDYKNTQPRIYDSSAHKYSDQLVNRVEKVYNQLKESCDLEELPHR